MVDTSPAAVLAGPGSCPACWTIAVVACGPSFFATSATAACFALSAVSARFASGTTPAATAVPLSETKSAISATTKRGAQVLANHHPFSFRRDLTGRTALGAERVDDGEVALDLLHQRLHVDLPTLLLHDVSSVRDAAHRALIRRSSGPSAGPCAV